MRPATYPERVVFHDNPEVIAALKAKAEAQSLTASELLRRAVRREVLEAA